MWTTDSRKNPGRERNAIGWRAALLVRDPAGLHPAAGWGATEAAWCQPPNLACLTRTDQPLSSHKNGNMLSRMKTTVDLPDDLFIAAKKRAAELRQPLRALIERGLRAELGRGTTRRKAERRTIRWVTVAGGLPPGVDVADRAAMHDWLRQQR